MESSLPQCTNGCAHDTAGLQRYYVYYGMHPNVPVEPTAETGGGYRSVPAYRSVPNENVPAEPIILYTSYYWPCLSTGGA